MGGSIGWAGRIALSTGEHGEQRTTATTGENRLAHAID